METWYIDIDSEGFVTNLSSSPGPKSIMIEVEPEHSIHIHPFVHQYIDGEVVFSETKRQEFIEEKNNRPPSIVEQLQQEVELLREQQKQSELVVLQVTDMVFDMMS